MATPSTGADPGSAPGGPGRWTCPACGLGLRPDDSIVVVGLRPFHVACAEASFVDRATWEQADVTTLSHWSCGIAWRSIT